MKIHRTHSLLCIFGLLNFFIPYAGKREEAGRLPIFQNNSV
ncbi:hypothetical protein QY97_02967 [Bacillus thermotolerans]|uniref:Uncharacterized protein n=1 Tax=Bacillus thermotolerans TaxID=1221996 RepID=A0A0F5HWA8_BACTR|nr:hypothetical protein QY97_02967 [Bacillus thermotolerans]KKB37355.1 hypothetical protein QY95_02862 [Bacillus thermotolerans]KKB42142.1 hypothetical protein QY96_01519 [Bacillus thermotolerans]